MLKHLKRFLVISSALTLGMFVLNVFGATLAAIGLWNLLPLETLFGSWVFIRWSIAFGLFMGALITPAMALDEGGE